MPRMRNRALGPLTALFLISCSSFARKRVAPPSKEPEKAAAADVKAAPAPAVAAGPPTPAPPAAVETPSPGYDKHAEAARAQYAAKAWDGAAAEWKAADAALDEHDPRHALARERLAAAELKRKRTQVAKRAYASAIGFAKIHALANESVTNAYLGMAYCLEQQGQKDDAARNYVKALSLTQNEATKAAINKRLDALKPPEAGVP